MLGDASQYMDFVQCQSRNLQTWHPCSYVRRIEEGYRFISNVEYKFWFCPNDIKCCVSDNKKKYVLDWPVVPNTLPVKVGTNLSRQEVLALEDVGFQLQQGEVLSSPRRLSTIATLPTHQTDFRVPLKLNAYSTSGFGKTVCRNLGAPTAYHKNKWESTRPVNQIFVFLMIFCTLSLYRWTDTTS